MAKYTRYIGDFVSRNGTNWRVEILQDADAPFTEIGALDFPGDEPLVIEWPHRDKEEVICGSSATLKIISPGDRTFEDLYTIEAGRIRLDVYKEGRLYWSGILDPEFYEEPYHVLRGYEVTLTFQDFGILDRLYYNSAGIRSLQDILQSALQRSQVNYIEIDQSLISTEVTPGTRLTLAGLSVRSDNFYDEAGEASTLGEVLEGVFQPLGLRMIQRAGKIYVYDLNGLYQSGQERAISWDGDSSTMGVDKVANNALITWSTYAQSGNQAPEECWTEETDSNRTALNNSAGSTYGDCRIFSYHYSTTLSDWIDATDCGFTLWVSSRGKNVEIPTANKVQFFKIVPQYDGTESEGLAIRYPSVYGYKYGSGKNWTAHIEWRMWGASNLPGTLATCGDKLFTSAPVWIPPVTDTAKLSLRVALEMLLDCRFNPFEQAVNTEVSKNKDWQSTWNKKGNFVYVPVTIKFQPDGSNDVFVWTNRDVVSRDPKNNQVKTLAETYGYWREYAATNDAAPDEWGYLSYYDPSDRAESCGVNGWKKNRPAMNPHTGNVATILEHAEDGQYIPFPPSTSGGKLWVEVRAGSWQISDGAEALSDTGTVKNPGDLWSKICWILIKLPEIEIVNISQFDKKIDTTDKEYKAIINQAAKDPIEIDTICGTCADGVPTARGVYFNTRTGQQITQLTRAGRTTQAENLLIGTLYSQYAERKTTLSGEVLIEPGLYCYTEQNQGEKRFMLMSDEQNIITDCSNSEYCEFRPDEYEARE